jgi:hypothetical protein
MRTAVPEKILKIIDDIDAQGNAYLSAALRSMRWNRLSQVAPPSAGFSQRIQKAAMGVGQDYRLLAAAAGGERAGNPHGPQPTSQQAHLMPKSSRRRLANPLLPGASPGARAS